MHWQFLLLFLHALHRSLSLGASLTRVMRIVAINAKASGPFRYQEMAAPKDRHPSGTFRGSFGKRTPELHYEHLPLSSFHAKSCSTRSIFAREEHLFLEAQGQEFLHLSIAEVDQPHRHQHGMVARK
jgi:hypothetical protein